MSPYPLNLPIKLQQETDDRSFPHITYRRGASGQEVPVLRGTSLRVQTIYIAAQQWGLSPHQIAREYELTEAQVHDALTFAAVHRQEIEAAIAAEEKIEAAHV